MLTHHLVVYSAAAPPVVCCQGYGKCPQCSYLSETILPHITRKMIDSTWEANEF